MTYHPEESEFNCDFCGALCKVIRGKHIHLMTGKKSCPGMIADIKKKIETGEIKPKSKRKLSEFFLRPTPFIIEKHCNWCGARWIYNEELPNEERIFLCPQCEAPGTHYEHPKYSDRALIEWAKSMGKEIPHHVM
jgi:hypothetical protein